MDNQIIVKSCQCGWTEWVEVAIVHGKEVYYWVCPQCNTIHNSTSNEKLCK